jgi:hypothetical protein
MFIDEFYGDQFYKQLPLGYHACFSFGQFFWTHAYYPHENLELWRPVQDATEPTKTIASTFRITAAGQDAFRRNLPLHTPRLETNEEFLVIRAKWRPVVLVQPEVSLAGLDNRGYRGRIERRRCLVAQVFGLADTRTGDAQFSQSFISRVRKMEFPQFMFLPQKPGLLEVDSLLRLDELQSVFTPHLDAKQNALGDEVVEILRGQIAHLLLGARAGQGNYTQLREMLLSD